MEKYRFIKIFSLQGVPVYMHWPLSLVMMLILLGSISDISLLVGAVSYWGVMLLHEFGHMYMAKKFSLKTDRIELSLIHGICHYEESEFSYINHMVAWGGFFAQAIIFVPSIIILFLVGEILPWYIYTPLAFFGYISAVIGFINLAPARGLDGAECWKSIPIYLSNRGGRKKKKKNPFKVVK